MSELTEEQLKELKLEEAKKKYEALKKKNKKKKKKDSGATAKEDSVEPDAETEEAEQDKAKEEESTEIKAEEPTSEAPIEEEIKEDEETSTLAVEGESKAEEITKEETKTEEAPIKESVVEAKEIVKQETVMEESSPRDPGADLYGSADPAQEAATDLFGASPSNSADDATDFLNELTKSQEGTKQSELVELEEPVTEVAEAKEALPEAQEDIIAVQEPVVTEAPTAATTTDPAQEQSSELFGSNEGPSFLETAKYQKQIEDLTTENESLKSQLEVLRKENKELKFTKFDHLDQIETLQAHVAKLEAGLAKSNVDSSNTIPHHKSHVDDDNLYLSPTPSYQPRPALDSRPSISTSSFDQYRNKEATLSVTEIKNRLSQWKNWNVDLTGWRTIGTGPVVEL